MIAKSVASRIRLRSRVKRLDRSEHESASHRVAADAARERHVTGSQLRVVYSFAARGLEKGDGQILARVIRFNLQSSALARDIRLHVASGGDRCRKIALNQETRSVT